MSSPVVLIVDDVSTLRNASADALKAIGCEILEATNPAEALQAAKENKPDLILLDVILPGASGIQVCRQIKNDPDLQGIYVILVSAIETSFAIQTEGLDAGADGYITRPIDANDLQARVRSLLRLKDALRYRFEFERLITTISTEFINLSAEEVDEGINSALKRIGLFADVDRSYIFEFSNDEAVMSNTHEWCREGIVPQIDRLQSLETSAFPWEVNLLKKGEIVHIPRVSEMPPEASAEKTELEFESIKSLVLVPMVYEGRVIGFVGFDSVRSEKTWSQDDITLLKIAGEIFVNSIERQRAQDSLLRSHSILHAIIEGTTDAVFMKDLQGRYQMVNSAATDLIGKPEEEILGHDDSELLSKMSAEMLMMHDRDVIATRGPLTFEETLEINGTKRTYLTTRGIYRDHLGGLAGLFGIARDITERKSAEQELRLANERFSLAAAAVNSVIYDWDLEKDSVTWADGLEKVFGYHPDQTQTDRWWTDHVHPDDIRRVFTFVGAALEKGHDFVVEYRFLASNGEYREVRDTGMGLSDVNGRTVRIVGSILDITEQKEADHALRESERRFAITFEANPAALTVSTFKGTILNVNAVFEQLSGFSRNDVIGKTAIDLGMWVHPELRSQILDELLKNKSVRNFASELRRKDMSIRKVLCAYELIELGGEHCILGMFLDVTDL